MLPAGSGNAEKQHKWSGAALEEVNNQNTSCFGRQSLPKAQQGNHCWRASPAKHKLKSNWQKHHVESVEKT